MDNYLAIPYNFNNNNNDKLQNIQLNSEIDPDQIKNHNLE